MPKKPKRVSFSTKIDADLLADLRDFTRRQRGEPLYLTVASFTEEALKNHLALVRGQLEQMRHGVNRRVPAEPRRR